MLLERAVVGAAAEVADRNISRWQGQRAGGAISLVASAGRLRLIRLLPRFVDGSALGAGHGFGHVTQKLLQAGNGRGAELRPGDCDIHVEICGGAVQFGFMLLGPFGGTDQSFFFAIPTAENHGALRLPT